MSRINTFHKGSSLSVSSGLGVGGSGLDWLENFLGDFGLWDLGRSTIRISVGSGNLPAVVTPGTRLPELVSEAPPVYALPLPEPVDRRDGPPDETSMAELTNQEWLVKMGLPPAVSNPVVQVPTVVPATVPAVFQDFLPSSPVTGADAVGWISDIYTTIDNTVFQGVLPGGAPLGGTPATTQVVPVGGPLGTVATGGTTGVSVATSGDLKTYCYKFVDGQWKLVKMRRRRRKKLVTKSDISGLAQLKGVIGMGKAFETWIATHS